MGRRLARTLRGREHAERLLGAPVLAQVPHLRLRTAGLTTVAGDSVRAKTLRRLRDNVLELGRTGETRSLLVCAPVSRQGKSIVAAGLAIGLAESGASAAAVDADVGGASLARVFGIPSPPRGLAEILLGDADTADVEQVYERGGGLGVIGLGAARLPAQAFGTPAMAAFAHGLADRYDYVVTSGPPLLEHEQALALTAACDGVVLVVRHHVTTVAEAEQARRLLETAGAQIVGVVVTETGDKNVEAVRPVELRARLQAQ